MPNIINIETGDVAHVDDETAMRMMSNGRYRLADDEMINVRAPSGGRYSVGQQHLDTFNRDGGYTGVTSKDVVDRLVHDRNYKSYAGGFTNKLKAFGEGAWSGLTFGLGDVLLEDDATAFRRKELPGYHLAGDIVGTVAPAVLSLGGSLAARGSVAAGKHALKSGARRTVEAVAAGAPGLAARGGIRAAESLGLRTAEAGIGRRIAASTVAGATEGAIQGGVREVGSALRDDEELTAENIFGGMLLGGVVGGAFGGGLSVVSEGIGAGYNAVKKFGGRSGGKPSAESLAAIDAGFTPKKYSKADLKKSAEEIKRSGDIVFDDEVGAKLKASFGADDMPKATDAYIGNLRKLKADAISAMKKKGMWKQGDYNYDSLDFEHGIEDGINTIDDMLDEASVYGRFRNDGTISGAEARDLLAQQQNVYHLGSMLEITGNNVAKRFSRNTQGFFYDAFKKNNLEFMVPVYKMDQDQILKALALNFKQTGAETAAEAEGFAAAIYGWGKNKVTSAAFGLVKNVAVGGVAGGVASGGGLGGAASAAASAVVSAVPVVAAVGLAAKGLRMAYSDPAVGGILVASTAEVLMNTPLFHGDDGPTKAVRTKDAERALRDFAGRVRSSSPAQAAAAAAEATAGMIARQPKMAAVLVDIVQRRLAFLNQIVDREVPMSSGPVQMLLRPPRGSQAAAGRVAEALRSSMTPEYFIQKLLEGRLTPAALEAAQVVFPNAVKKAREYVMMMLAEHGGDEISPRWRRAISQLMASPMEVDTSHVDYLRAMQAPVAPSGQNPQGGGRPVQISSTYTSRMDKALNK